eukprot:SAG31_NODE_33695_length_341_cov_0.561983_1_plen_42_part_10
MRIRNAAKECKNHCARAVVLTPERCTLSGGNPLQMINTGVIL